MEANHQIHRTDGFSLIELSIVMIIIGIIVSAGITVFKPSAVSLMNNKTEIILKANTDALIGHTAVRQQLPSQDKYPSLVRSQKDGFGKDTHYISAQGLAALRSICDTSFTNISLIPRQGGAQIDNIAFILQSYGNDGKNDVKRMRVDGATTETDITNDASDLTDSRKIIFTVPPWVSGNDPDVAKDDILQWATLAEIQAAAKCGPALRITTTNLADGVEGKSYNSGIFALGGTHFPNFGNYEWCGTGSIPDGLGLATMVDQTPQALDRSASCSIGFGSWQGGDHISITSGDSFPKAGSGTLTIFARDNDGSTASQHHYASQTFILSVSSGTTPGNEDPECEKHRRKFDKKAAEAKRHFDEKSAKDNKSQHNYDQAIAKAQEEFEKKMRETKCRDEWNWGWGWGRDKEKINKSKQGEEGDDNQDKGAESEDHHRKSRTQSTTTPRSQGVEIEKPATETDNTTDSNTPANNANQADKANPSEEVVRTRQSRSE